MVYKTNHLSPSKNPHALEGNTLQASRIAAGAHLFADPDHRNSLLSLPKLTTRTVDRDFFPPAAAMEERLMTDTLLLGRPFPLPPVARRIEGEWGNGLFFSGVELKELFAEA